jgi:transcriptional regulator with XRE-family HTH domain
MASRKKSLHTEAFGDAIWEIRKERGMSQEELGFAAGLHRTYIGRGERGEVALGLHAIVRIAAALEVRASELVRRYEQIIVARSSRSRTEDPKHPSRPGSRSER